MSSTSSAWQPWRSLTWEYARNGRRTLATVTLASWTLAALYHRAMEPLGARRDAIVFASLFFTLLIVNALAFASCREDQNLLGFERRLFRLPWPTWKIVVARFAPAATGSALLYVSLAIFMRQVYDVAWPVLGPALLFAAATGWTLTLLWTLGHRPYLLAPATLALIAALANWIRPFLQPGQDPGSSWEFFGTGDSVGMLSMLAAAIAVSIWGVGRHRSAGTAVGPAAARLGARSARRALASTRWQRGRAFRSPLHAVLWRDWKEKGRWITLQAAVALAFGGAVAHVPELDLSKLDRSLFVLSQFVLLAGPWVAGFLHGRSSTSSAEPELDRLRATLPRSDQDLGWQTQISAFVSVIASWCCVPLGALLLAWTAVRTGVAPSDTVFLRAWLQLHEAATHLAGSSALGVVLLGLLLLAWGQAVSGLTAAVVLTGRNWVVGALAVVPMAGALLALLVDRIADADAFARLAPAAAAAAALLLPGLTVAAGWLSVRRGHLRARTAVRLGLFWVSLTLLASLRVPELRLDAAAGVLPVLLLGATSAVVAPWVLTPLAVAWNRHR